MKRIKTFVSLTLMAATVSFLPLGCATHDSMQASSSGSYPLTKCVVSGEDLGDQPYVFTHNGQTVKLCCKDCLAKFNQNPDQYMAKIAAAK